MSGLAWFVGGVLSVLAISLLLCLLDDDMRRDIREAVVAILLIPAAPVVLVAMVVARRGYHIHPMSPAALRRYTIAAEARGLLIHRTGRAVLVITAPKRERKHSDV